MKFMILLITALIVSHMVAMWVGSSMQLESRDANSHAHLSDVGDAITLGEYFAQDEPSAGDKQLAARATGAIIHRILISATPGPNSKGRLEVLEREIFAKYPKGFEAKDG